MVFALQHISYYSIISMTVSVPAMDDPLALRKLLGDCLMSSIIIEHIIGLGYTTISMIHSTFEPHTHWGRLPAFLPSICLHSSGHQGVHGGGFGFWSFFNPRGPCGSPTTCPLVSGGGQGAEGSIQCQSSMAGELLTPATTPSLALQERLNDHTNREI